MIGQTISHYKIIEKIGEGGMGVVYKAQDLKLDRFVALKFLPQHLTDNDDAKKRFIHEAKAASALDHPNICNVHEIDETSDGQMFIAMAYYEGESLRNRLRKGALEVRDAIDIVSQIATGLGKAHEKDIVHRDIKPANILITTEGMVKIVDFGLAKLEGRTKVTKTGTTLGTVAYMSPEQATGEEVDARSDIFSLGAVFYEMLTGRQSFPGDNEAVVVYRIVNEEPLPLTTHRAGLPQGLQHIVDNVLKKNRAERYQLMDDLLGDLKGLASADEWGYRKRRKSLIRRTLVISTMVLIFVGGFIGYKSFFLSKTGTSKSPGNGQERFMVAIAPFWGHNAEALDEGQVMKTLVEREVERQFANDKDITLITKEITEVPRSHKEAERLGESLGAAAMIWGEVLTVGEEIEIQPHLTLTKRYELSRSQRSGSPLELSLSEPGQLRLRKAKAEEIGDLVVTVAAAFYSWRDPDKSLLLLERISPPTSESTRLTATAFYYMWDYSEAERLYKKAIELDPENSQAHVGLGKCYFYGAENLGMGDETGYGKGIETIQKAIEIDPNDLDARISLGYVFLNQASMAETNDKFEDAETKFGDAERVARRSIQLDPQNIRPYLLLASIHTRQKEYDKSRNVLRRAMEIDPVAPGPWVQLAWIYGEEHEYEKAVRAYKKAIELWPNHAGLYLQLGEVLGSVGDYDGQFDAYKSAFGYRAPGYTDWMTRLFADAADRYSREGEESRATTIRKWMMELEPVRRDPISNIAPLTYVDLGKALEKDGQRDEALEAFEKAARIDSFYLFELANYHIRQEDYVKAERVNDELIEKGPGLIRCYAELGSLYVDIGRYDDAIRIYEKSIEADSTCSELMSALGGVYLRRGEFDKALNVFQRAVERFPSSSRAFRDIGHLYYRQGEYQKAASSYKESVSCWTLNPNSNLLYLLSLHKMGRRELASEHIGMYLPKFHDVSFTVVGEDLLYHVLKFYAGEMSERALLDVVENEDRPHSDRKRCEAYFYIGMAHLLNIGFDKELTVANTAKASKFLNACVEIGMNHCIEYEFAKLELERLTTAPDSPRTGEGG